MASDNKPKFQPWNEEEFQADVYVRGMTPQQRWMYRTLLQAAFFHGTRPYLPTDDEVLWILAGCESPEQWQQNKEKIMRRFTPVDGFPDLMQNKRVVADWSNLQDFRDVQSDKGRQRAAGAERAGGRFIPRVFTPAQPDTNQAPAVAGGGWQKVAEPPAGDQQEKRSEEKGSEEKERKEKPVASQHASSPPRAQPNSGGDWKTIAIKCRRQFGKIPADARSKDNYAEACFKYSEDVVLAAFDEWAQGAGWVKEKGYDPLRMFLKALPDIAGVMQAEKELEQAEGIQRAADAAQAQRDRAARESQIAAARLADAAKWDSMSKPSTDNEVSLADYLEDTPTDGQK
jgi:hypothetical protein